MFNYKEFASQFKVDNYEILTGLTNMWSNHAQEQK